jgi:hypothetical protein
MLPVGLKLRLDLQELRLRHERVVMPVTSVGTVDAEVVRLVGEGGNGYVILCCLSNYQPQTASRSPPPWGSDPRPMVVLKVPRKPDVMTAEEQELFQEASSVDLWEEHDLLRKPQLQKCEYRTSILSATATPSAQHGRRTSSCWLGMSGCLVSCWSGRRRGRCGRR